MAQSFFLGILSITLLFFICAFLGVGIVFTFNYLKDYFKNKRSIPLLKEKPDENSIKPVKKRRSYSPKVIKSIEINPEEIDRIYVKKTG